jgi:cytochrome d ubiquinol oxidase subunit I
MDAEVLSRLQFAVTIMFHYIFVPFSIGTGLLLVIYEAIYYFKRNPVYEKITRFWIKIFAANFSIGVATGIVMEFEFGTNWANYARFVGDIFGSPLAAEGIFAFFLESGFLAVLLFGWGRVKPAFHLFSTVMVFLGSLMSAFWIIAANSWMHTPVAYEVVTNEATGAARAVITDFWTMVFNPSTMIRFTHTVVGAFIQGAFLVMSVSAWYLLKHQYVDFAKRSFTVAVLVAALASLSQVPLGHIHAQTVAEHQPMKLAAMEGLYETKQGASLTMLGTTDPQAEETQGLSVPGMLSWLAYGDANAEVKGLNDPAFQAIPKEEWPDVSMVFQSFHLMVALGMVFIGATLLSLFLIWRGTFFRIRWLLWAWVFAVILPILANQLGWITAERGRQPWVVQGLLKTENAVSESVSGGEVLTSLIMFGIVYTLLFFVWLYVLDREIKHGPADLYTEPPAAGYQSKQAELAGLVGAQSAASPGPAEQKHTERSTKAPPDPSESRS